MHPSRRLVKGPPLLVGAMLAGLLAGCPMEPDPPNHPPCKPGTVECLGENRIRTCGSSGRWIREETVLCAHCTCDEERCTFNPNPPPCGIM